MVAFLSSPSISAVVHPFSPLRCCAASPPTDPTTLIRVASSSLDRAVSAGHLRVRLDLIVPGLNTLIEDTAPFSDTLLNSLVTSIADNSSALNERSVALLYKSAGTAAAAKAQYAGEKDVLFASYSKRDGGGERIKEANMIVRPTSERGARVMEDMEAIVSEAPEAIWVLINPDFGIDRAATGMKEMERRRKFLDTFINACYFRNLFIVKRPQLIAVEMGILMYTFGEMWNLFALTGNGYVPTGEFEARPDSEKVSALLNREIAKSNIRNKQPSGVDSEFLRVIAACAVTFAIVAGALYAGGGGGF